MSAGAECGLPPGGGAGGPEGGARRVLELGRAAFGRTFELIAGPCSVESREQIRECAAAVAASGARVLRGGAYKPRTSPYSFQGLEETGLRFLREAADEHGLLAVSEVMDSDLVGLVGEYVDIFQVGARNMANFRLLKCLARAGKPVLLKRGYGATVEELLLAAEYLTSGGNDRVILCERGIRTFEPLTRFTLDLSCVALIRRMSPLPIVVDPSHATGRADLVPPMCRAALAAGADGLMVEIHPRPAKALCDGLQALGLTDYAALARDLAELAPLLYGRDCP